MLADARESTHVRPVNVVDFRRASDLDVPDYETHQRFASRALCGLCGQYGTLGPFGTMVPHPVHGHICKAHGRSANPTEAA
jgi:hypothetical protein